MGGPASKSPNGSSKGCINTMGWVLLVSGAALMLSLFLVLVFPRLIRFIFGPEALALLTPWGTVIAMAVSAVVLVISIRGLLRDRARRLKDLK